jgi:hypothetical protein
MTDRLQEINFSISKKDYDNVVKENEHLRKYKNYSFKIALPFCIFICIFCSIAEYFKGYHTAHQRAMNSIAENRHRILNSDERYQAGYQYGRSHIENCQEKYENSYHIECPVGSRIEVVLVGGFICRCPQ